RAFGRQALIAEPQHRTLGHQPPAAQRDAARPVGTAPLAAGRRRIGRGPPRLPPFLVRPHRVTRHPFLRLSGERPRGRAVPCGGGDRGAAIPAPDSTICATTASEVVTSRLV